MLSARGARHAEARSASLVAITGGDPMILKYVTKGGSRVYGPPYTKEEEADFYRRNAGGPITVARRADDRKEQKSPKPQQPSPAKPRRS